MATNRPPFFVKYGLQWTSNTSPLAVEFEIIAQTDEWRKQHNLNLFDHYREAQSILWPTDDHHRWSDLALRAMVENEVTVFMGCSDANKTWSMAKFVLVDWWARPDKALWMVSSTELRGAELRIWGVIKQQFNRARELHRNLPGTVLESAHVITTDATCTDNSEGRLLTRGVVFIPCKRGNVWTGLGSYTGIKPQAGGRLGHCGDECFPAGTMVDTPTGSRAIETIRAGDEVISADGPHRVIGTMHRPATSLYRINTTDGREIVCTGNHPLFTQHGWIEACKLASCHYMLSAYETMHSLRNANAQSAHKPEILLHEMPCRISDSAMHQLRKTFPSFSRPTPVQVSPGAHTSRILFNELRREMAPFSIGHSFQDLHKITRCKNLQSESQTVHRTTRLEGSLESSHEEVQSFSESPNTSKDDCSSSNEESCQQIETFSDNEKERMGLAGSIQSSDGSYSSRKSIVEGISRRSLEFPDGPLSHRRGISNSENSGRSRWSFPFSRNNQEARQCKRSFSSGAWVASVEILQQEDFERYRTSPQGVEVYTLQVEGHSSYSVNGLVAKNCQSMEGVFLDAYSNFYGKAEGSFKGILAGNPFDLDDTLCRAAEPAEGWDSWHDTEKTQVWRSKFYNAQVVAFDGRDSPNFDYPPDQPTRYKYLIGRKKIEAVGRTHGKDSWQWFMQCVGKPRPGAVARRVVTRAMCETYHAFSEVTWLGEPTIKIGACDAAYGGMGGDRCVAGHIEFGKDVNGHVVVACHPLVLVPVKVNRFVLPEDQIANFVRDYMQSVNVPPENFFFDGRGSLAVAFARLWSPKVEAVEFGGRATERPVSNDTFMWDGDRKTRRLQRCDELYSRFVTELWFAMHMVIISDQMRQLPQDMAAELCRREWDYVQNSKIEIETKAEMKERTGESPDLADCGVILLEGARRRGFQIARLPGKEEEMEDASWKMDLRRRAQTLRRSYTLTHSN